MRKLTFLFALLCVSVMGWAAAVYTGTPFTGDLGGYNYNISYTVTYNDDYSLTFTAEFTGTFAETTGLVFEVWSSDFTGNLKSFVKGEGNIWSVTDNKDYSSMVGSTLNQLRFRIASSVGGTDQLYLSEYTVGLSNSGGEDPTPDPDPEPAAEGEKFIAANAAIDRTIFYTYGWAEETTPSTCNWSDGELEVTMTDGKNEQWQAQVFLDTKMTYDASKQYDISFDIITNNGVGGIMVKLGDAGSLYYETFTTGEGELKHYTKENVQGVAANDGMLIFDFGYAPANTTVTISNISIIEHDAPAPATVEQYCRKATGQQGNAEFGDVNGRILLTLRKLSDSSVRVKVEPNNNGVDYFDLVHVELNGTAKDLGTIGGAALSNMEFDYTGLTSLDFSVNVLWHNHNWADVNGRWSTGAIAVTETELCEETTELSVGSEYCSYSVPCDRNNGAYAYITWTTTEDGDVIISLSDGIGSTNSIFRGNGMGGDLNGFTVLSGAGFGTSEPASDYFNRVYGGEGSKT